MSSDESEMHSEDDSSRSFVISTSEESSSGEEEENEFEWTSIKEDVNRRKNASSVKLRRGAKGQRSHCSKSKTCHTPTVSDCIT